jgi:hypothetical protein
VNVSFKSNSKFLYLRTTNIPILPCFAFLTICPLSPRKNGYEVGQEWFHTLCEAVTVINRPWSPLLSSLYQVLVTSQDLTREQRSHLETIRGNPQNPLLLYHLADRKLTSQHFRADLLIDTRYSGHKLRINKYSNGVSFSSNIIISSGISAWRWS